MEIPAGAAEMDLVRLAPDFGVEIRGIALVDVAASDKAYQAVRAAFEEHSVLLFRNEEITDDLQAAFSRRVRIGFLAGLQGDLKTWSRVGADKGIES